MQPTRTEDMKSDSYPPRLAVVAAIVDGGRPGDGPVTSAARMSSTVRDCAVHPDADAATTQELALAEVLQWGENGGQAAGDAAMADLLYLADDCPGADKLAAGLSQKFLRPDDSAPGVPAEDRRSAFVDLYRKLALHQLENQVRNKAAAVLRGLTGSRSRSG
jgi:hypothetical protein